MQAFITNGIASLLVSADGDPWIPLTFAFRDLHGPLTTRLFAFFVPHFRTDLASILTVITATSQRRACISTRVRGPEGSRIGSVQ